MNCQRIPIKYIVFSELRKYCDALCRSERITRFWENSRGRLNSNFSDGQITGHCVSWCRAALIGFPP